MGLFQRLAGTVSSFFQIGNAGGPGWNDNAGSLDAKDSTNTTLVNVRVATPLAVGINDAANKTYVDTTNRPFPTTLQFNGNNPLPNNSATEQYYVVSTTGPNATIGQILWDNGTSTGVVTVIPALVGNTLVTVTALSGGTVTFAATSVYVWTVGGWVNISPATSLSGVTYMIRFALALVTADSVTSLPVGAVVYDARLDVTTPYSPGATIEIGTTGSLNQFQATTDNDPQVANLYSAPQDSVVNAPSVIVATVAGAPAAGTAEVMVLYALAPNT